MYRRRHSAGQRRREVYRKKLLIVLSFVVLASGLGIAFGENPVSAHDKKCYKSVEIAYGDTLWDLAEQYRSDDYESVQSYIQEVKKINGLLSDDIQEGQYLTVPYYNGI